MRQQNKFFIDEFSRAIDCCFRFTGRSSSFGDTGDHMQRVADDEEAERLPG